MANGFRQLTPEEINRESVQEVTPPWEILAGLIGAGGLARLGLRGLGGLLARKGAAAAPSGFQTLSPLVQRAGRRRTISTAEAPRVSDLTRPWVGRKPWAQKTGSLEKHVSYDDPLTFDLTD